jgi:hypothetical protein
MREVCRARTIILLLPFIRALTYPAVSRSRITRSSAEKIRRTTSWYLWSGCAPWARFQTSRFKRLHSLELTWRKSGSSRGRQQTAFLRSKPEEKCPSIHWYHREALRSLSHQIIPYVSQDRSRGRTKGHGIKILVLATGATIFETTS